MKHTPSDRTPPTIREKFDWEGATRFGGSPLLIDYAHHIGLCAPLQQGLAAHAKRDNAVYPLWQTAALLILGRVLGLARLAAFALGEEDPLLRVTRGLRKLPDAPLLYRDLERMGAPAPRAALEPVQDALVAHVVGDEILRDLDTTVETVYGHQAGTAVGYNPTKHGRASYHPLVACDGRTRAALRTELRPGNTVATTAVIPFLDQVLAHLPDATRVGGFRADRGFQGETVFGWCEARDIPYTIKMTVSPALQDVVDRWRFRGIGDVDGDRLEVAAGLYQAQSWTHPRRVGAIRKRVRDGLFTAYCYDYQAIVTTLPDDPEDVLHVYNHRCTMETMIGEAKAGFGIDAITSHVEDANRADLALKGIAYHLALAFQRDLAPPADTPPAVPDDEPPHRLIQTVRRLLLHIPAILVHHARGWTLRLSRPYARWGYPDWRARLEALSA